MSQPERANAPHAIVLAAGAGARFDGNKLLAPFRGAPLLVSAVRTALATHTESVLVVLGSGADALQHALDAVSTTRLRTVRNPDWREGLSGSLRCGLANLPDDATAILVFLGDMPNVSADLGDQALEVVGRGAPAAFPVFAGMPGHPVAMSPALFPALHALTGDQGARSVLAGLDDVVRIETDDVGCVHDVDTRDDLRRLA